MGRLILTFDPPVLRPDAMTPVSTVHEDIVLQTTIGPKLGSDLEVGNVLCVRPGTAQVIASITPEV